MYAQLMRVSRGFRLVYIGLLMVVGAIALIAGAVCLIIAAAANARPGFGLFGVFITVVAGLLSLAGVITSLIGKLFCLSIPDRAGPAKQLIIVSVAMELIGTALGNVDLFIAVAHEEIDPLLAMIFPMGGALLNMGSTALFLIFTKYVAQFVNREDLGDTAMSVLWLFAGAIGFFIIGITAMIILALAGAAIVGTGGGLKAAAGGALIGSCLGGIAVLTGGIIWLIGLIRFIVLMTEMSNVVDQYARSIKRPKRTRRKKEKDEEDEDEEEEDDRPRGRSMRGRWDIGDDDRPRRFDRF